MKPLHLLMVILVPIFWGMGLVVAKAGIEHFSPIFLMALRFTLASICLLVLIRPSISQVKDFFWIALIGATVQYSFTYLGVAGMDAATAGLLIQLEVPFGLFLAWLVFGDRLSIKQAIGIMITFLGAVLIIGEPKLQGDLIHVFFVIIGAFAWAVGQVMVKKYQQLDGFVVVTGISVFAAPQLFLTSLVFEDNQWQQIMTAPAIAWFAIVYLGLIMTTLGYSIWYYLLGRYDLNTIVPYLLLVPLASVVGGVLLLGESLTIRIFVGGVLAILGIAFITIRGVKNRY